jgi:hypothetical protein
MALQYWELLLSYHADAFKALTWRFAMENLTLSTIQSSRSVYAYWNDIRVKNANIARFSGSPNSPFVQTMIKAKNEDVKRREEEERAKEKDSMSSIVARLEKTRPVTAVLRLARAGFKTAVPGNLDTNIFLSALAFKQKNIKVASRYVYFITYSVNLAQTSDN